MPRRTLNKLLKFYEPSSPERRFRHHHFLAAWIRSPLKIGAFLPSSRALARAMAAQVDIENAGAIIELGGGTGAVTQALLQAGASTDRLIVVERDRKLHAILSAHFPQLKVICADAIELDRALIENGVAKVNAIVSSLPLLSMPRHARHAIEQRMANAIGHHGVIVQFTYGPRSPISSGQMRQFKLQGKRVKLVMANMPPAHVWAYRRA